MTRQYWSHHRKLAGLITDNLHIARLLINNFRQPELPLEQHVPYANWKAWLAENPKEKRDDK